MVPTVLVPAYLDIAHMIVVFHIWYVRKVLGSDTFSMKGHWSYLQRKYVVWYFVPSKFSLFPIMDEITCNYPGHGSNISSCFPTSEIETWTACEKNCGCNLIRDCFKWAPLKYRIILSTNLTRRHNRKVIWTTVFVQTALKTINGVAWCARIIAPLICHWL